MRFLGLQCGASLLVIAVVAAATGPTPPPKQIGTVSVSEAVGALLGFLPGSTEGAAHTVAAKVSATSPLPPHPRLRVRDDAIATIKALISNDAEAARYFQALVEYGNALLSRPLINCSRAGVEHSLLAQARDVLDKTYTLGLLFRINGNQTFAQRAIAEMLHVTGPACVDWNPSHFLDTAEMTHAVAIGYDWLYHVLTPSQRQAIERGTIVKGLDAGVTAYKHNMSYLHTVYNWDLVTNAGLLAGAIAFADVNASVSAFVIRNAVENLAYGFSSYAPSGGWPEGTMYWGYATKYALLAVEALVAATGSDHGFSQSKGFNETGMFKIQSTGPTGLEFNWGDATPGIDGLANLFGLGRLNVTSNQATRLYAAFAKSFIGPMPTSCEQAKCALNLIHFIQGGNPEELQVLPTTVQYRFEDSEWNGKIAVALLRQTWDMNNTRASFAGIKAGNGMSNHNDLDAGSFVLDMAGHRWAIDLGADNYGLPGYFTKSSRHGQRYSYYRKSSTGHNTWVFNSDALSSHPGWSDQADNAVTEIEFVNASASAHAQPLFSAPPSVSSASASSSSSSPSFAVIDLTPAYARQGGPHPPPKSPSNAKRGFAWTHGFDGFVVRDEIDDFEADNVTWVVHTSAAATVASDGTSANLTSPDGTVLYVTCAECTASGPRFSTQAVKLEPPQDPTNNILRLQILADTNDKRSLSLTVTFTTESSRALTNTLSVAPLSTWQQTGPFV